MRYELRRWTDETRTDYVVRQTSDDRKAIEEQFNRAFTASTGPNLLHIVDTQNGPTREEVDDAIDRLEIMANVLKNVMGPRNADKMLERLAVIKRYIEND